ncbi:MarC family protein [Thermovibrio ammonificans]|uniref:UPF0056 inner membrane protein n=1 Tax=Thermovibrio ammonificans (strain DSM 15698 / JCM 12110 / HB-1) TaxID=648996 RepID=E8T6L7_THEA1|nr:MarC family protein [Thermovibrio ammonificans]ADU96801.1 multiple antibiotic resistance (MarC)-related protein [Thermovibrio ammonificans HB-1]
MELFKYLISLLVIVDPIFAAVMVATLLPGEEEEIKRVAFKASATVLVASFVTLLFGQGLLKIMGVNIYSIKIFGGLILLSMAFQMLQANPPKTKHTKREEEALQEKDEIAVIPIGIPILFGPGTFTTLLIFREEVQSASQLAQLVAAVVLTVAVIYFTLEKASLLARKVGPTGIGVTVRVFGLFVGALGSQFVVEGVKHLWSAG